MIPELVLFAVLMAAMWQVRRWQLRSLQMQERFLLTFAEGLDGWRNKETVSDEAKSLIDRLARMSITKWTIRRFAWYLLTEDSQRNPEDNSFLRIRQALPVEQQEPFDWLLITFFIGATYSDWLTGWFVRRVRVGGLSNSTKAEVAVETIFSRQMGEAAYA